MCAETWGIVLRDGASGAEQWVACEVEYDGARYYTARSSITRRTHDSLSDMGAVEDHARFIERNDRTLSFARVASPDQYAAHMDAVRNALAADEVERLRAAVAERDATIANLRHASNRAAVAYAESLARNEAAAFRRGAEAMREAAACEIGRWWQIFASEATTAEVRIRRLPLPVESTPQPAQGHEATATPDAPLTIADAAARARSAAAQRAECDHRWLATLDGLRFVCLRCPEVRQREEMAR